MRCDFEHGCICIVTLNKARMCALWVPHFWPVLPEVVFFVDRMNRLQIQKSRDCVPGPAGLALAARVMLGSTRFLPAFFA